MCALERFAVQRAHFIPAKGHTLSFLHSSHRGWAGRFCCCRRRSRCEGTDCLCLAWLAGLLAAGAQYLIPATSASPTLTRVISPSDLWPVIYTSSSDINSISAPGAAKIITCDLVLALGVDVSAFDGARYATWWTPVRCGTVSASSARRRAIILLLRRRPIIYIYCICA